MPDRLTGASSFWIGADMRVGAGDESLGQVRVRIGLNGCSTIGALVLDEAWDSTLLPPNLNGIAGGSGKGPGGVSLSDPCDLVESRRGLQGLLTTIRARLARSAINRMRDLGFIVISILRG